MRLALSVAILGEAAELREPGCLQTLSLTEVAEEMPLAVPVGDADAYDLGSDSEGSGTA